MKGNQETRRDKSILHPDNCMDLVRITENAALACYNQAGLGNEHDADLAAVTSIRNDLNQLPINGRIVIGEGTRDQAPMLFIGEIVGQNSNQGLAEEIDIALDPLEGTTLCAHFKPGSFSVVCFAPRGVLLQAPDVYMEKIVVGPNINPTEISLDNSTTQNLKYIQSQCGIKPNDLIVTVLNRPRHEKLITEIRQFGAKVRLIQDGDISASIRVGKNTENNEIYMGSGGAPEGVIAASALKFFGGNIKGRLLFKNENQKDEARKLGFTQFNQELTTDDMVKGDSVFCASGVTDGDILPGVTKITANKLAVHSLITYSKCQTMRYIESSYINNS